MAVNYTPTRGDYKDLTPFRFWCQKVLPMVYDDSLSYYELLCKVVDYLNKTMEDVGTLEGDVTSIYSAYESLQTYVNDYFDNLDVQDEIDDKLDRLVEDGTIHDIFNDDIVAILAQGVEARNTAIANVPSVVTNWLNTNITQETGYVIDNTLTVQNAAADAKKVGDELKVRLPLNSANRTSIAENADLNDITALGTYKVTTAAIARTISNMPTDVGGMLIVIASSDATHYYQIYTSNAVAGTTIYTRIHTDEGWSDWRALTYNIQLEPIRDELNVRLPLNSANRTAIAENADLNDITALGTYKVTTTAIAHTLTNLPTDIGGMLIVIASSDASHYYQIYTSNGVEGTAIYLRIHTNSGWSDWRMLIYDEQLNSIKNELNTADSELLNKILINNSIINTEGDYINYGYNTDETYEVSTSTYPARVGVNRRLTDVVLNGEAVRYDIRVKLNNNIERAATTSAVKNFTNPIDLISGEEYELTAELISGSSVLDEATFVPPLSVYKAGESNTVGVGVRSEDGKKYTRTFVADGSQYHLCLYCTLGMLFEDAKIRVLLRHVESKYSSLKPYYEDEMKDTINKVLDYSTSPSLTFMVTTDIHRYSSNASKQTFEDMITNMRYFAERVKCDFLINLGDLTDGNQTKEVTKERGFDCTQDFVSIGVPYFFANGNHDTNYATVIDGARPYLYTLPEIFKAYYPATKDVMFNVGSNGTDFYVDYEWLGIRVIVLNANSTKNNIEYAFDTTAADWLVDALDTNKRVVLFMHQSFIASQVYSNITTYRSDSVRTAIQNFINNGGNVIMFSGHSHLDIAFIEPWLSIMQMCARFTVGESTVITPTSQDNNTGITDFIDNIVKPARATGTYSEDCWSVCVYKPMEGKFATIRFGAGSDRYFNLAPITSNVELSSILSDVNWSSSNTSVATVSNGYVSVVGTGKCAIIAKDSNGNYECWIVEN